MGLNFFENYYTVFDYENLQIGFADSVKKGMHTSDSFMNWSLGKKKASLMNLISALNTTPH